MRGDERVYRNPERGWIGGVFAGLADHLRIPVFLLRLLALPLFVTPLLPFAVVSYVVAVLALPVKPATPRPDPEEEALREALTRSPADTFGQVRHRFRELERRIRRLEAYVTSPDYEIDDELRGR